jgi:hypothetical protein
MVKQQLVQNNGSESVWFGRRSHHLIVFLVGLLGQEARLLQLVLQGVHALFICQAPVLKDLAHTVDTFSEVNPSAKTPATISINKSHFIETAIKLISDSEICLRCTCLWPKVLSGEQNLWPGGVGDEKEHQSGVCAALFLTSSYFLSASSAINFA